MAATEMDEIERNFVRWYPARITAMTPAEAWSRPPMGLYTHIPYCAHRCHFCKYKVRTGDNLSGEMDRYLDAIEREIATVRRRGQIDGRRLNVIYIGGGTPSMLEPRQLQRLLDLICGSFELEADREFSMEWSPVSLTAEKLAIFKAAGGNRLSVGVQSFNDVMLEQIGRDHTADKAREALRIARDSGFDNVSLDLMYRLPGQTVEDVRESVRQALECEPAHVSLYPLWVREGTVLWSRLQAGALELPDEAAEEMMYAAACEVFEQHGFGCHYNVFDFVRNDAATCRYTKLLWEDGEWVGLGNSAVTFVDGRHTINTYSIGDYMEQVKATGQATAAGTVLSTAARMRRTMVFGLRIDPFDTERFRRQYGVDVDNVFASELAELQRLNLLRREGTLLRLTRDGVRKMNNIGKLFYDGPDFRQTLGVTRQGLPILEINRLSSPAINRITVKSRPGIPRLRHPSQPLRAQRGVRERKEAHDERYIYFAGRHLRSAQPGAACRTLPSLQAGPPA